MHWGSVSWSDRVCVVVMLISVDLMCPAISGALSTFPFQAGCWNVTSFLAEAASCIPEATIIRWVLAVKSKTCFFVFPRPEFPPSMRLIFGWVSVVVLEQAAMTRTFLSSFSITRAICLAWLKFNFFLQPINVCRYGRPRHLHILDWGTKFAELSFFYVGDKV